jgi:hypothetical protein
VVVQNNSEEPIHDCVLTVNVAREHWEEVGSRQLVEPRQILPPGRTEVPISGLIRRNQSQLPTMQFTDSAGLRWTLSHTGKLARVVDLDDPRAVSGWHRVLPWRRHVHTPTVVEEQSADAQSAERPTQTGEAEPTDL